MRLLLAAVYLGLSGKMLEVASDGALVLKHFDVDPFGLEASVLGQSIGQQAAQSAPAPAPPAASVAPILGMAPEALGDFLPGGLMAFDQKELIILLTQKRAKKLHRICSHKRKLAHDRESQGAEANGGAGNQASKASG